MRSQAGFAHQVHCDETGPVFAVLARLSPKRGHVAAVRCSLLDDPEDLRGPAVNVASVAGVQDEHGGRVGCRLHGGDRVAPDDGNIAQIPRDGVVDDQLEQFGLGPVAGLDGLDRDAGLAGHGAHGRAGPAQALEDVLGRGHDVLPRARGRGRAAGSVVSTGRRVDGIGHIR
jgi:hypothetical protein